MTTAAPAIRIWEGNSTQQGAAWDGLGVNFSLFSANATKVELCLFDQNGTQEIQRIELPEYTDEIWHGYLPDADRERYMPTVCTAPIVSHRLEEK